MQRELAFKKLFEGEEAFASSLLIALVDLVQDVDVMNWDPETITAEIKTKTGATISSDNMDRLMGLCMALTTNQFYTDVNAFIQICNALSGAGVDFKTFDPATVSEMAWAVSEVLMNDRPDVDLEELFSPEIRTYVGMQADEEGLSALPKILSWGEIPKSAAANFESAATYGADMFSAVWGSQQAKVAAVEGAVAEKLTAMKTQINSLPLLHRVAQQK
jgi:hypothetical protein